LQTAYGSADQWSVGEIAVPDITDKEVLVKITAAGLDRGTWHLMTGLPSSPGNASPPKSSRLADQPNDRSCPAPGELRVLGRHEHRTDFYLRPKGCKS